MILAEKRRDMNALITKRIDDLSSTPEAPAPAPAPGELFIAETTAEVLATTLSVRGTTSGWQETVYKTSMHILRKS
jgi:hypothetical protein